MQETFSSKTFKNKLLTAVFTLLSISAFSQTKYTLSGTIKDKKTGETVIGAIVRVSGATGVGASTNEYGFYSLTLVQNTYNIEISNMGYKKVEKQITLDKNITLNVSLEEDATELTEVEITSGKKD
ncbi:MAG TPA: carboxypeptidase-like regulatory domain-containing protein, partial [Bacteroidia bacterium]